MCFLPFRWHAHYPLGNLRHRWFSKGGDPWINNISTTWELVKNAILQPHPELLTLRLRVGPAICVLTSTPPPAPVMRSRLRMAVRELGALLRAHLLYPGVSDSDPLPTLGSALPPCRTTHRSVQPLRHAQLQTHRLFLQLAQPSSGPFPSHFIIVSQSFRH